MEHPQGVLSQREQEKVDDPARESMGTAPRRMLMATMASTLGEKLKNVQNALRGGVAAAAIGAAAMGGMGHAVAADNSTQRMEEIPTLSSLQNHTKGSNDASERSAETMSEHVDRVLAQDAKKLVETFNEQFGDIIRDTEKLIEKEESERENHAREPNDATKRFAQTMNERVDGVLARDPEKLVERMEALNERFSNFNRNLREVIGEQPENNSTQRMEEIPTLSFLQNHARGSNDASERSAETMSEHVDRVLAQDAKKLVETFNEQFGDIIRDTEKLIEKEESEKENHAKEPNDATKRFAQTMNERVDGVLARDPEKLVERMEALNERFSNFNRNLREVIGEQPEKGELKPDDETMQKKELEEAQARMETENVRERFHRMINEGVERALAQDPNKRSRGPDNLIEGLGEFNQKIGNLASARFENTPSGKESMNQQIDSAEKQQQAQMDTRTR